MYYWLIASKWDWKCCKWQKCSSENIFPIIFSMWLLHIGKTTFSYVKHRIRKGQLIPDKFWGNGQNKKYLLFYWDFFIDLLTSKILQKRVYTLPPTPSKKCYETNYGICLSRIPDIFYQQRNVMRKKVVLHYVNCCFLLQKFRSFYFI